MCSAVGHIGQRCILPDKASAAVYAAALRGFLSSYGFRIFSGVGQEAYGQNGAYDYGGNDYVESRFFIIKHVFHPFFYAGFAKRDRTCGDRAPREAAFYERLRIGTFVFFAQFAYNALVAGKLDIL